MTTFLYLKPESEEVKKLYDGHSAYHKGDSGIDLFFPDDIVFKLYETKIVDLHIKCEMVDHKDDSNLSYYLYARSSISKTPLSLCNSVGIIDSGYRGNIKVALKYSPSENFMENAHFKPTYTVKKGERLVQICHPSLIPIKLALVESLSETSRGEGGFGSTGK